jgi:hypothetical protein
VPPSWVGTHWIRCGTTTTTPVPGTPMLYQIDGTSTRIFGTMHLVPQGQDGWEPYARRAYDWSKEAFGLPSPHSKEMPAAMWEVVKRVWNTEAFGPLESANLPAILFLTASSSMNAAAGVEVKIGEWMPAEKSTGELEGPQDFAGAFDNVPSEVLIEQLRRRIGKDDEAKQRLGQMYRAWRGQSGEKMVKLIRSGLQEPIRAALFDQRNAMWAPRVAALTESTERTLICVGAGHLHGPRSLRELLAQHHGLSCSRIEPWEHSGGC